MIDQVRPADLTAWLKAVEPDGVPVVLDVREPSELRVASVKPDGFEMLTIPMGELVQRLSELDPQRPVACLCHHGSRSMQVASFLQRQGFLRIANIAGGIHAWSVEVDPSIAQY
ncbi:MAG: hypothetical protein RIS34_203 [Pseudomonadota bacterium]|jgi:rhodanese-related sulfurtransferase